MGKFATSEEAWFRRIQSGQAGEQMFETTGQATRRRADCAILPTGPTASPKASCRTRSRRGPQGVERNIVVTTWDWLDDKHYLHDLIASDRRYPTVNAYGPLYGSTEYSTDIIPILDPKTNSAKNFVGAGARRRYAGALGPACGERQADAAVALLGRRADLDYQGEQPQRHVRPQRPRLVRGGGPRSEQSCFLQERLGPSFGQSLSGGAHEPPAYDARSEDQKYTFVDTCFGTHHLQFGYDANDMLWTSGGGPVVGWLNTKMFDETGDAAKVAGLDAVDSRHQRQRQARRLRRAESAGGPDEGQAHRRPASTR